MFITIFLAAAMLFRGRFKSVGVEPALVTGLLFPISFGLYGIAVYATAVAANRDWMRGFAAASWIFSIAALYFVVDPKQFLVAATGSVICVILRGAMLMLNGPSKIA